MERQRISSGSPWELVVGIEVEAITVADQVGR